MASSNLGTWAHWSAYSLALGKPDEAADEVRDALEQARIRGLSRDLVALYERQIRDAWEADDVDALQALFIELGSWSPSGTLPGSTRDMADQGVTESVVNAARDVVEPVRRDVAEALDQDGHEAGIPTWALVAGGIAGVVVLGFVASAVLDLAVKVKVLRT